MKAYTLKTGLISLILFFIGSILGAQTLTTNKPDYPPGDTVFITGTGFNPEEIIQVQVLHTTDGFDNATSPEHQPWQITADINGSFQTYWIIPFEADELNASLLAIADGLSSGLHAEVYFTDAAKCIQSVAASGAQTICQNVLASALTLSITSGGSGSPVTPTYQWFSNAVNNNTTGTIISGATSATYAPSTLTSGVVYYYCVVTNTNGAGTCAGGSNRSNTVSITVNPAPSDANAGPDQNTCVTTATLAGNTPGVGSGIWTLVSGAGTITTNTSPTSGITGLGAGINTFKWTITNGTCSSFDNVNITLNTAPVISLSSTNINKSAAHGTCSANVTFNNATSTGSPTPSITYSPVSGSLFPVGQILVTATATNTCGISSATFTVTVTDDEKPSANPPAAIVQNTDAGQCYATANLGTPVTSDNCGIQSVTNNAPAHFPVGITIVTWTVTDVNGNQKTPTQQVTISDIENPNALTKNITIQLNALGSASIVASDIDNGSNDPCGIKSLSASKTNFDCSNIGSNTVTLTVTDNNNNISTANATVTVEDKIAPVITCPVNKTINCDASQLPADNGIATATDNCDNSSVITSSDVRTQNADVANIAHYNYIITRTWKAQDASGNFSTCDQILTVQDTTKPVVSCPLNKTINCDASQLPADNGIATATDNCDNAPVISSTDISTQNANVADAGHYNYTITRTWKALDVAGNFSTCNQILTIQDTTKPIVTCPLAKTINCNASQSPADNGLATATDNCDNASSITSTDISTQNTDVANTGHYNYTITRTWKAMDVAGNYSTCDQIITVQDTTKPVVTCPTAKTINCDASSSPAYTGIASATDNCDGDPAVTSSDVSTQNADASNAGHYNYTITRTWKAMDVIGNYSTCNQIITVRDTTKPVVTCPVAKTINCDASQLPASTGVATATDNCDNNPVITFNDVSNQNTDVANAAHYNYSITRTWKAMDVTGNFKTCNQIITIQDTTKPVVTCPVAKTINCDASQLPASTGIATATDNCDNNPAITSSDVSNQNTNVANAAHYNYTITRTWKALDASGNFKTCNQIITVQDTTKPVVTCPVAKTINCDASQLPASTGVASATDNCDNNPVITSSDVSTQNANVANAGHYNYTITRTWKAMDVAGNYSTCNQIITIQDTTKPVVTCPTAKTISCDGSSSPAYTGIASATDNCDDDPAVTSSDVSTQNADASNAGHYNYTITRTWKAMDVIGNYSTCNQIITVRDTTKPVITCPLTDSVYKHLDPYSITYTVQGNEFNATATDNCSPVTVSYWLYGATTGTGTSMSGVALNNGKTTVRWTATDISGNLKRCYFYINVGIRPTTLTILHPTPSVTSAQYSDSIPLQAELIDYDGLKVHGKPVVFQVGTQILPAVYTDVNGLATTKIKLNQNPNTTANDNVKATFTTDATYAGSTDTDPFDVTREDACGVYNGVLFANTNSESGGSATVRLKVFVTEANDGSLGDVRLATVAFTVMDGSTTILSSAAATLDPSSTSTQATFYKDVTISLTSSVLSKTLDVSWAIAGYYTDANCTEKTTEVTVSAPAPDFVTGGGFEILQNSGGSYSGDAGSKNNFGFSVKWNKNLTNIQGGGINSIIRKNGHLYQVKGNKVTYLNVVPKTGTVPAKAVFYCNAVIKDVTDPLNNISLEGNATAIIEITDAGEPGSNGNIGPPDSIAITVKDKNGALWFSSNWIGSKTIKQAITGGNIQIRTSVSRSMEAEETSPDTVMGITETPDNGPYKIKVFPNPTDNSKIIVSIIGYDEGKEPAKLYIFDVTGKLIYSDEKFCQHNCKETVLVLGGRYSPGTYLIDVVIENKTYHQKLIIQ